MTDHDGVPLVHGRPRVNGVDLHCATGGSGDPVVLIHGVPLECPVLAVGGRAYLAAEPGEQMAQVAVDVTPVVIEQAGHNIPLEAPAELARRYLDFFASART
ncbi:alpha/beta fold hydrolase [Streptomyces sp. 900105755]